MQLPNLHSLDIECGFRLSFFLQNLTAPNLCELSLHSEWRVMLATALSDFLSRSGCSIVRFKWGMMDTITGDFVGCLEKMPDLIELSLHGRLDSVVLKSLIADIGCQPPCLCPKLERLHWIEHKIPNGDQMRFIQSRWSTNGVQVTKLAQVSFISYRRPTQPILHALREFQADGMDVSCIRYEIASDDLVRNWLADYTNDGDDSDEESVGSLDFLWEPESEPESES